MKAHLGQNIATYWSLWVVGVLHLLFIASFSTNVAGDASNYLHMLTEGKTNLIHAPGYPFLLGAPWRTELLRGFVQDQPRAFLEVLQVVQHLVFIIVLACFFRSLRAFYSPRIAHIATLIWGLHYGVLGSLSMTQPEWLQSVLLVLSLILLLRSLEAKIFSQQLLYFSLAALVFTWCYLVKFNGAVFVLCFIVTLAAMQASLYRKVAFAASAVTVAATVLALFITCFHFPLAKTRSLSYDHAWVLLSNMTRFVPSPLQPETGISTKRLILLNSLLPSENEKLGPVFDIDQVSPEAPSYRSRYLHLLEAEHEMLDSVYNETQIRPISKELYASAFFPTAHYLGWKEGNALGTRVFLENVLAFPVRYGWSCIARTLQFLYRGKVKAFFPQIRDLDALQRGSWSTYTLQPNRPRRDGTDRYFNPYGYRASGIGVVVFTVLAAPSYLPNLVYFLIVLYVIFMVLFRRERVGLDDAQANVYLLASAAIALFVLFSNMILNYRPAKEHLLVVPLIAVVLAVAVDRTYRMHRQSEAGQGPGET